MSVYFDVGANDGTTAREWCKDNGKQVYLFEPNPDFAAKLREEWKGHDNVHVYDCALADYNGDASFYLCDACDKGCSSLLPLSEKAKTSWGGRTDMIPAEVIIVKVRRLDSFDFWPQIEEIEHFHCDAQGSDLRILQGMGQFFSKIKTGVIEAGQPEILYQGQNTIEESRNWIKAQGYKVTGEGNNDPAGNEVNMTFER